MAQIDALSRGHLRVEEARETRLVAAIRRAFAGDGSGSADNGWRAAGGGEDEVAAALAAFGLREVSLGS